MKQLTESQLSNALWFMDACIDMYGHGKGGEPRRMEFYREQYYMHLLELNEYVSSK